jgi:HK97 family phage major capsid protein
MDEILLLKQQQEKAIAEARSLLEKADTEKRELSDEEQKKYDAFLQEITARDSEIKSLEKRERLNSFENALSQSAGTVAARNDQPSNNIYGVEHEFRSIGEFLHCARFAPTSDAMQPHIYMPEESRDQTMGVGADGGFMVPEKFRNEIFMVEPKDAIVRPRATIIGSDQASPDSPESIPALSQGAKGVYGGVKVNWTGEGKSTNETEAGFGKVKLTPHELTAFIDVSNKLLRNASNCSAILTKLLRSATLGAQEHQFIIGDGVAKPLGIVNSGGAMQIARIAANKIQTADVLAMLQTIMPDSNPVFIASQSAMTELFSLKDDNNNNIVVRGDATKGIPHLLFGYPLIFTGKTNSKGNKGDLILADLDYYIIKDGLMPVISMSTHSKFTSNETQIKIVSSVDGAAWMKEPLTLEDGSTQVSPFVLLK